MQSAAGSPMGKSGAFSPSLALDAKTDRNTVKKRVQDPDARARQLAGLKPWQPGVSPNPSGCPKGSLNRLQGDFMWELAEAFKTHGKSAIEAVIADKPHEFLKICASLMPKELTVTTTVLDEMSLEQLEESLATLKRLQASGDVSDVEIKSI